MHEFTRRTVLGALGTATVAGFGGAAAARRAARVERVLSTGEPVPENVAFDASGALYVGITGGSVRRLPAACTGRTGLSLAATTEVATYPGGVAGVLVADGTLYTAVNGDAGSVYEVPLDDRERGGGGGCPGDGPTALATLLPDGNGFVNDLYADGDRLLVSESMGGAVHEVPRDGSGTSVWVQADLLDTPSFGANGLTRVEDAVYVAVTRATADGRDVGRIVRVPVAADGSAGTPETFVEGETLYGADGLTARGGDLYVAVNAGNRITRVTSGGELQTVVEGDPLVFPSEVVFDPTSPRTAFVCNFAPETPEAAGVLRTRV